MCRGLRRKLFIGRIQGAELAGNWIKCNVTRLIHNAVVFFERLACESFWIRIKWENGFATITKLAIDVKTGFKTVRTKNCPAFLFTLLQSLNKSEMEHFISTMSTQLTMLSAIYIFIYTFRFPSRPSASSRMRSPRRSAGKARGMFKWFSFERSTLRWCSI